MSQRRSPGVLQRGQIPGAYLCERLTVLCLSPRMFQHLAVSTRRWRSIAWSAAFPAETRDRASVLWLWRVAAGFLSRRNISPCLIGCFPCGFLEQGLNLALEGILVHHP